MLEIHEREIGAVTIFTLEGSLVAGAGSAALAEKLAERARRPPAALVLDCSGVSQLDSEGIGALVTGFRAVEKRGGALKLLRLSPHVQKVLSVLGLLQVFETFSSEERAVASFPQSCLPAAVGARIERGSIARAFAALLGVLLLCAAAGLTQAGLQQSWV
jgi:anti-sigma B factor antagonist